MLAGAILAAGMLPALASSLQRNFATGIGLLLIALPMLFL